ncbi:MAG: DUF6506 family protein [Thermoleophilia bacterium]
MARIDYLFIFLTEGCDPAVHRSVMDTPLGKVVTVGASTVAQACDVAAAALANGEAQFIEVCGAFGEEGCRKVSAAVGGELPVGYVTYAPEERVKVDALFG